MIFLRNSFSYALRRSNCVSGVTLPLSGSPHAEGRYGG
jgi:hypothetical protein